MPSNMRGRKIQVDAKKLGLILLSTASVARSFSVGSTSQVNNNRPGVYLAGKRKQRTRILAASPRDHVDLKSDERIDESALLRQFSEYKDFVRKSSGSADEGGNAFKSFDPFNLQQGGKITSSTKVAASTTKDAADRPNAEGGGMGEVWTARLLLIVAAALYGTNFTCVKVLDETVPVGISTTLRFALAALATLPWLLGPSTNHGEGSKGAVVVEDSSSRGSETQGLKSWGEKLRSSASLGAAIAGLEVGAWNSIGYIAQAVGLETTDASKSAFICSLAVVIVPILDFFAGKKILPREIVGAAMAVAGVGFLELGGAEAAQSLSSGDVASLVQPLAFGLGFWRMEAGMHRFPEEAKRMTAAQILAVFLASASYGVFLSGESWSLPQITEWVTDPMILGALFWTGCITTALTVYMETLALKTLSAAETTMIFSTEPLWGAAFASLVVGEHLGLGAGVGGALILGGCLFSNMGSFDWLGGSKDDGNAGKVEDVPLPAPQKNDHTIPKSLLGPGLSVATPAVAIAALSSELAGDSPASAVGETLREKLGEM